MNFAITAIGSMSAESTIDSLRKIPNARIIGLNSHPAGWTAPAAMVDSFHQVPPAATGISYIQALRDVCIKENIDYVVPLTDPEVDVLNVNRKAFAEIDTLLCMAPYDAIATSRDKLSVYRKFKGNQHVRVIPSVRLDRATTMSNTFPLVAKPALGRSSEGLVHISDHSELAYWQKRLTERIYLLQPYLDGHVCVVDMVRQRSTGHCSGMARRELVRSTNGAGLVVEMLPSSTLVDTAERICEALDVNGCINIEFLVHLGQPMLMDINPRFSAGIAFTKLAGYDMVINHLRCFNDTPIENAVIPVTGTYAKRHIEMEVFGATKPGTKHVTERS